MNRRALILAGLFALPTTALPWSATAQRRRSSRHRASGAKPTARRRVPSGRGGLTASHIRTRIVGRTFATTTSVSFPPGSQIGNPYPLTIPVSGLIQGRILKVRVSLIGLSHQTPNQLDIMVVDPGNVGVILMSDSGGFTDIVAFTLTFDQDAANRVPEPITGGTFQAVNDWPAIDTFPPPAPQGVTGHSLTHFNNRNPNGIWRLYIVDDSLQFDGGSLGGWALHIQARVRVPHQHRRGQGSSQRPTRRAKR
jgi:hypothetical protein